jgi:hypothetical protein
MYSGRHVVFAVCTLLEIHRGLVARLRTYADLPALLSFFYLTAKNALQFYSYTMTLLHSTS